MRSGAAAPRSPADRGWPATDRSRACPDAPVCEPSRDAPVVVSGRPEHVHDLWSHLATAGPQARPDRRDQILGSAPELRAQRADRHAGNPLHRASPARVNGGDRRPAAIGEQNRCAIGDANADAPRRSSSETIPSATGGVHAPAVPPRDGGDASAVHLADEADAIAGQLQELGDARPLAVVAPKLEIGGREEVPGVRLQRDGRRARVPTALASIRSRR